MNMEQNRNINDNPESEHIPETKPDHNMPDLTDEPLPLPVPEPTESDVPEQPLPPPVPQYANDFERMMALPPISKQEAESCRHRLEKRWYRRLIIINILLIVTVLLMVLTSLSDYREKMNELSEHIIADMLESASDADADAEEDAETDDYYEEFVNDFPIELQLLGYGFALLVIGYLSLYLTLANVKASSVKITQRNFPEIYQLIFCYAQRLGMERVPDAYIVQQSGVLNAFSSFIFRRQYIQINSEIFEVAYREHKDLNALGFVIAHELSHIYYGHATLHYNLPIWFSMNVPLFSAIASRTREYSCDRLAQRLTNYDGMEAIIMLMVDRHLYKMVDKQDYIDQTAREGGFFLWLVNLLSTHPIMPKRIRALAMWHGSGELY